MNLRSNLILLLLLFIPFAGLFANKQQPNIIQSTFLQTDELINLQQAKVLFDSSIAKNINSNFINAGLVKNYIWIHYKIQSIAKSDERYIVLDNSRLNKITAYFTSSNTILDSVVTGDFNPFSSRRLIYPNFRFKIPQTTDSAIDAYFFIDHKGSTLQLPIYLKTKEELVNNDRHSLLYIGLKMGLLSVPLFFGFFLFLTTKNKTYLLYSLYVFISATWLWSTDGYGFQYMWQLYPQINNRIEASFGVLYSGIFTAYALQFTKQYQLEKSLLIKILKWLMWFFFVWGIVPLIPFVSIEYSKATPIFLYLFFSINILAAFIMLGYLFKLIKKNGKPILFFLFAVANTIIFSILVVFYNLGFINLPASSSTFVGTGMIIDIVFMTLGLAYQFNQYKLDKEKMLIEYWIQEKSINAKIIKTQEDERQRISREMHDDIGSGLTRITMMSEAAKNKSDNGIELNEIAITGRKIVSSLSEIIWSMQPNNNNLEQLFSYLREQLNELLEYTDIRYEISFPNLSENQKLTSNCSRNIILISKEIVNNAIKYSKCNALIFKVSIADDGIGFDTTQKSSGNGLQNIQYRMKQIDRSVQYRSDQSGTIFKL